MNTHDIDIELPPLPPPFKKAVYATSANTKSVRDGAEMGGYEKEPPLFDDAQMQDYAMDAIESDRKRKGEVVVTKTPEGEIIAVTRQDDEGRILSVIAEADSKRGGEPDYYTYVINGWHRGISETAPPDDAYDEGTLQALYTAPQPAEPRLDAPAQVGHTRFGQGVPWATVIGAAQRYHAIKNTPTKEQERIKKAAERIKALQPAEPVSAPKHLIERLQKHSEDKSNTAFARSTMREALQYLTAEPCASSVSDKTACGSANGDCDSQPAEP